jgi:hypothetical protein
VQLWLGVSAFFGVQNTVNSFTTTSTLLTTGKPTARRWCTAFTKLSTTATRQTQQNLKKSPKKNPTFFDDLSNAIWRVIALAAIPGIIVVASCEQHTSELGWAAGQQANQRSTQEATQEANQQVNTTSHTSIELCSVEYSHHTPEGFGATLSHGGTHDPQKQD